jgi:hypothetical protein
MPLPRGSVVIFDDRVLHRGLGNSAAIPREVGYFSYKRKAFTANTHFEAYRSLSRWTGGDAMAEAVRKEFPGIGRHPEAAFCDGAGGSQARRSAVSPRTTA